MSKLQNWFKDALKNHPIVSSLFITFLTTVASFSFLLWNAGFNSFIEKYQRHAIEQSVKQSEIFISQRINETQDTTVYLIKMITKDVEFIKKEINDIKSNQDKMTDRFFEILKK